MRALFARLWDAAYNLGMTVPVFASSAVSRAAGDGSDIPAELVLVSNGPGEVSNWAVPMARSAAAWAANRGMTLKLSLILPPCQFASGQEAAFARRQNLFTHILGPRACLGIVAGLRRFPVRGRGCVLHLGGDLWYSVTLGRRLGFPAFAYAETMLVRKRAHRFARVFVPSQALADRLAADGVPAGRMAVVGDLRVDHLSAFRTLAGAARPGSRVALLPGSRRWIIAGFLPFLLETAAAIRAERADVSFSLIASPFLPRDTLTRLIESHGRVLQNLAVDVVQDDRLAQLAQSDLAITLPGTNTVELAILGVPMLVAVPLDRPERIRIEGMKEWLGRIPGLGSAIKGAMVSRFQRRPELLAWPNREAGRPIVPEIVGRITPAEVARRAVDLLNDAAARDRMARELRALYATPAGVAQRMMDEMAPCFHSASGRHAVPA
jgi:hypothetical protein